MVMNIGEILFGNWGLISAFCLKFWVTGFTNSITCLTIAILPDSFIMVKSL